MFKRTRLLVCAVIVLAPASLALQGAWAQSPTTMDPNMDHSQMNMGPATTVAASGGGGGGAATTGGGGGGGAATTGGGSGGGAARTGGGGGGAATTGGGATGRSQATGGGATTIAQTGAESRALTTMAGTMVLLGALLLLAASNRFASGRRVVA